ncbi:MAG: hypothetical protein M3311_01450 [Thermoproteota archaeon]|nr:hypothetical protein [Thermoproteota archaeon]
MLFYASNENNGVVWLECARICFCTDRKGFRVLDQQEVVGFNGGSSLIMDWYAVVGLTTMAVFMSLIGVRLAKDELVLRRKRLIIGDY